MGMELRTGSDMLDRAQRTGMKGAEAHIIIAFVVSVPGDEYGTIACGGDGRLPVVRPRVADADFGLPREVAQRAQKDIALAVAKTLVGDMNAAIGRGCGADKIARSHG